MNYYAIMNTIKAHTEETYERLVEAFKNRLGQVEKQPGFRTLIVLENREKKELKILVIWRSRQDFEKWLESRVFLEAHTRARGKISRGAESVGEEYRVLELVGGEKD